MQFRFKEMKCQLQAENKIINYPYTLIIKWISYLNWGNHMNNIKLGKHILIR